MSASWCWPLWNEPRLSVKKVLTTLSQACSAGISCPSSSAGGGGDGATLLGWLGPASGCSTSRPTGLDGGVGAITFHSKDPLAGRSVVLVDEESRRDDSPE